MTTSDNVLLKLKCPKWFLVIFPSALLLTIGLFILMAVYFGRDGFTWPEIWKSAFFLAISALGLWLIPFIYSSIVATESGLQVKRLLGRRLRFTWDEIVRVSTPSGGIPREFIYIFRKSGEKIVLLRSMEGYSKLLELIESRASNLSPKKLPREVWPGKLSWKKTWLAMAAILLAYIALKLIFDF